MKVKLMSLPNDGAEAIRGWHPWTKSMGPRSEDGKARSSRSVYCGGQWREEPSIKRDVLEVERLLALGDNSPALPPLRPYANVKGTEWFYNVSPDPITISPAAQRPRP